MTAVDSEAWSQFLRAQSGASLLQSPGWGELKSAFGWETRRIVAGGGGAQVLFRRLPLGFRLAYIPKGPLGIPARPFWDELKRECMAARAIAILVEPPGWEDERAGWEYPAEYGLTDETIQPPRTIVVDLQGDEDTILARMKQKTRYNIRLAQKKGVTVTASQDIALFSQMMAETGKRDGFGVHAQAYYQKAWDLFHPVGLGELLVAWWEEQPLAALMVFRWGEMGYYLYGASTDRERNRMPAHLLQWEAMRWARRHGCSEYDLWGIPDEDEAVLEAGFETRGDGLWGVYRFKRGFGGRVVRSPSPRVLVVNPLLYRLMRLYRGARSA